jgi:hypothetical protein
MRVQQIPQHPASASAAVVPSIVCFVQVRKGRGLEVKARKVAVTVGGGESYTD